MRRFVAAFEDDGAFDAADAALSNVDASEAARRQGDPINALDIPSTGGWLWMLSVGCLVQQYRRSMC
jgi:hypothetical protein